MEGEKRHVRPHIRHAPHHRGPSVETVTIEGLPVSVGGEYCARARKTGHKRPVRIENITFHPPHTNDAGYRYDTYWNLYVRVWNVRKQRWGTSVAVWRYPLHFGRNGEKIMPLPRELKENLTGKIPREPVVPPGWLRG